MTSSILLPNGGSVSEARFRSGAVARMVGMPVTTLRVWERRYGLGRAATTASGHRLYSAPDVERLALVKRLTEMGHAIGSIAGLDIQTLQSVAATHATTRARAKAIPAAAAADQPAGVVVVGEALANRLQRPGVQQSLASRVEIAHTAASLADSRSAARGRRAALLLVAEASLSENQPKSLLATARAWGGSRIAVVYGYATREAREAHREARIELLRGMEDDAALATWIDGLLGAPAVAALPSADELEPTPAMAWAESLPATVRRYDDVTLTDFAGLSTTIACECPRHVAELLMQLSNFEDYSAGCASRDPEDAKLHDYLHRVAGASRALFEQALERLAVHEGLVLKR